jgi:hypothetical protein
MKLKRKNFRIVEQRTASNRVIFRIQYRYWRFFWRTISVKTSSTSSARLTWYTAHAAEQWIQEHIRRGKLHD